MPSMSGPMNRAGHAPTLVGSFFLRCPDRLESGATAVSPRVPG